MTINEIRQAFEEKFKNEWTSTTIVGWENSTITIPTDDYWVRFTVLPIRGSNAELGHKVRTSGLVILQIFGPKGVGTGKLFDLIDDFNTIMENYRFPGLDLFTYASTPEIIGESPSGSKGSSIGFYQVNAKIPFEAF